MFSGEVQPVDGGGEFFQGKIALTIEALHGALRQAARPGKGVGQLRPQPSAGQIMVSMTPAFASLWLVSTLVESGLLVVCPPETSIPGSGYSALCVPGRERHPPVRAFLSWVVAEAQAAEQRAIPGRLRAPEKV
jgi:DNA-binding transcriptional LysR family regulator